jgi:hypothetical protein
MGKNYQKLYTDDVYRLAETLVIKSEDAADKINQVLINKHGASIVDLNDKKTWKYYLNICGEYHPTDTQISIVSIDTLQTITFNRDNLLIHISTAKDYQYGTRNYNELVSLFPDMEMFILGVLYPAVMEIAISAPDGTIVSYPPAYVEDNEVTLISKINAWIENYRIRWYSRQFGLSDNYYTTVYLGMLYLNMVPAIINIRLAACKGPEAHSFHVRQYLLSHGMLDNYLDYLTKKQSLFFYRNIRYIERNNGKRSVFKWLTENIMTQRGLPLSELNMRHDVSGMPSSLYPTPLFRLRALNNSTNASERIKYDYLDLLGKERELVYGNPEYLDEYSDTMEVKLKNSLSNVVATKVLDSSVIDYTDATPYTLHNISINHWLYLSAIGKFNTYTSFQDPRTGNKITLHCKDAFIFFSYAYFQAMGGNMEFIPTFVAQRVVRVPRVTVPDLMEVTDPKYTSIEDATKIIAYQPAITNYVSIDSFKKTCKSLFDSAQNQLGFIATAQHHFRRALLENMVARTYCDIRCTVALFEENIETWKIKNSIPTTVFSKTEYLDIYKQLFENTTGSSLNSSKDLQDLQNAMVGLFSQLSSYSVQFITEVNSSNIKVFNWGAIRLGDVDAEAAGGYLLPDLIVNLENADAKSSFETDTGLKSPVIELGEKNPITQEGKYHIAVTAHPAEQSIIYTNTISIGSLNGFTFYQDESKNLSDATSFIGYDEIWRKKDLQIGDIRDIYCDCFQLPTIKGIDLNTVILDGTLGIFKYLKINDPVLKSFVYVDMAGTTNAFVNITDVKEIEAFKSNAGNGAINAFKPNAEITDLEVFNYNDIPNNVYVSDEQVYFLSEGSYLAYNFDIENYYESDTGIVFLSDDDETFTPDL